MLITAVIVFLAVAAGTALIVWVLEPRSDAIDQQIDHELANAEQDRDEWFDRLFSEAGTTPPWVVFIDRPQR